MGVSHREYPGGYHRCTGRRNSLTAATGRVYGDHHTSTKEPTVRHWTSKRSPLTRVSQAGLALPPFAGVPADRGQYRNLTRWRG